MYYIMSIQINAAYRIQHISMELDDSKLTNLGLFIGPAIQINAFFHSFSQISDYLFDN